MFFFFGLIFEFFEISPNVKRLGFLNIISWSSYITGFFGWYKLNLNFQNWFEICDIFRHWLLKLVTSLSHRNISKLVLCLTCLSSFLQDCKYITFNCILILRFLLHLFCAVFGFIKKNVNQLSNQIRFSVEKNTKEPDLSNQLKIFNIHADKTWPQWLWFSSSACL